MEGSQLLSWRMTGAGVGGGVGEMAYNQVWGPHIPFSPLERINLNHKKKTERIPATLPHRLGKARSGERCSFQGWNQRRKAPSPGRKWQEASLMPLKCRADKWRSLVIAGAQGG